MKKYWVVYCPSTDNVFISEFASYEAAEDFALEQYDGFDLLVLEAVSVISAPEPTVKKLKK